MKKITKLLTLSLASLMLGGLVSCSNKKSENSSSVVNSSAESSAVNNSAENSTSAPTGAVVDFVPTVSFDKTKEVNLTFYHTMGQNLKEVFDDYLEDFNEIYPNIKVTSQAIGTYNDVRDQMTTTISAGNNEINLAYCYPDHVAMYNKAKSVISLDGLIRSAEFGFTKAEKNDFISAYYEEGQAFGDGKTYSLPFSKSSEVLYYNKTFFDENNIKVPTHWWSTGEDDDTSMDYVMRKIKSLKPDSKPLGYDSESNLFITLAEQTKSEYTSASGEHYLFNNDGTKDFMKKFKVWYDAGLINTKQLYGGYTNTMFTKGECYMCIGSSAGASYQDCEAFETEVAPIPQVDDTNKKVIQQGPNVCIYKNADQQKVIASWLLLKFFTTNVGFQAQFSMMSGYTPVLKSVKENEIYANWLGNGSIQSKSTSVCMNQLDNYFTSPAFVGSSKARETVGDLVVSIFKGDGSDASINKAFADAITTCNG